MVARLQETHNRLFVNRRVSRCFFTPPTAAMFLCCICVNAVAQNTGIATIVASGIPNIRVATELPKSFDARTATDEELRRAVIPPKPNKATEPERYQSWEQMFTKQRITPQLKENPDVFHGPARELKEVKKGPENTTYSVSTNWSGFVITSTNNSFKNQTDVNGTFIQPGPRSGCIVGPKTYNSSYWVGVDGLGSPDVFQIGTEMALTCGQAPVHYAWVEWFPQPEVQITNLPISQGSVIGVYVSVNPNEPNTPYRAFISNDTNYVELTPSPPAGTSLVGNCIEWIAERPAVNGQLTNLTDFGQNGWFWVAATQINPPPSSGVTTLYPSSAPAAYVVNELSMVATSDPTCYLAQPTLYVGTSVFGLPDNSVWFNSLFYGNGPNCMGAHYP